MLDRHLLNPVNYSHVGAFNIPNNGKDLLIPPRTNLAPTMLVRWQINQMVRGGDISQVSHAQLISEIEVHGYGVLESSTFDIPPSDFKTKRIQIVHLNLELPQKISFRIPPDGILNSIIEFYAYTREEPEIYTPHESDYMPSSNPINFDSSTITNAFVAAAPALSQQIASASAASNLQSLNQEFNLETAHGSKDLTYVVKAWSGDAKNHLVLGASGTRIGYKFFNRGTQTVYVALGDPTGKTVENYIDSVIPGGYYISTEFDRALQLILYVAPGKPDTSVSILELLP
jgi:hypothetical protein